jgi:hypothetical protein
MLRRSVVFVLALSISNNALIEHKKAFRKTGLGFHDGSFEKPDLSHHHEWVLFG